MKRRGWSKQPDSTLAENFAGLRSDYDAAKQGRYMARLTGVAPMGSGADYHYRVQSEFLRMIERFRAMDRNNMVVGQAVDRVVHNVIQDGLQLDTQTGHSRADEITAGMWADWATDPHACDCAGERTFHAIEKLTLRHTIVDGDLLHLPVKNGSLQAVEAHRLRTPMTSRNKPATTKRVVHGVLLNALDRRQEYWLAKAAFGFGGTELVRDFERYPARDAEGHQAVFHIYNPKRFSQTRGISAFAPIVFPIGMHDDLQFINLVRAKVAACFSVFRERHIDFQATGDDEQRGEQTTETLSDGSTRTIEGIAPGMEIFGEPGEKLIGFSPNVPNAEFFEHAMMILSIIAVNLNLPVQVLLLDAKRTNFSGWRGAMDQARIGFRDIQQWLVAALHRPVYLWKVRDFLAQSDELRALSEQEGVNVFGHRWKPPGWDYVEPLKDSQADNQQLEGHTKSPRRVVARHGLQWPENVAEIVEDVGLFIEKSLDKARDLNARYEEARLDWREIAYFFSGPGQTSSSAPQSRDESQFAQVVAEAVVEEMSTNE